MIVVLTLSQMVAAAAPSITVLAGASLLTGFCSPLLQNFVAIIAEIAPPNRRGRALGTQLTAMFSGILFARIAGGLMATHAGWRYGYVLSAGMLLAITAVLWARLPSTRPTSRASYGALMMSTWQLLRAHGGIRRAAAIQFMFGICYGGFWAVAAPMLAALHRVGPTGAGMIGIPGSAGILVARSAGRWTDRVGVMPVVLVGICSMLAAWIAMGGWRVVPRRRGAGRDIARLRLAHGDGRQPDADQLGGAGLPSQRANTLFGLHVWGGNACGRAPHELDIGKFRLARRVWGRDECGCRGAADTPGHSAGGKKRGIGELR
jgi:MFS family permease